MWNIKYNLKNLTIPTIDGYDFIYKSPLYIPFKRIGINALVRKETPLPLEEETILKLLKLKYKKISDISRILGIDENILNDIIGEMCLKDLIYVKADIITITPKGETVLKKLTQLIIKREIISLQLDGITGDFSDEEKVKNKIPKYYPCLDSDIDINAKYLEQKSTEIEKKYDEMQSVYNLSTSMVANNQIYQLLDIDYDKTEYIEKNLLIYKNSKDNDFFYDVASNEKYSVEVTNQIKNFTGMKPLLRSRTDVEKYDNNKFHIEKIFQENYEKLITAICKDQKDVDDLYFKDRLMLDKEYVDVLLQIKEIKPEKILISSSSLDLTCTSTVINGLYNVCDTIPICIVYNNADYKSKCIAQKMNNGNKKIKFLQDISLRNTQIILYPHCFINVEYVPHWINGSYLLQEIPTICFNEDMIRIQKETFENKYQLKTGKNKLYV